MKEGRKTSIITGDFKLLNCICKTLRHIGGDIQKPHGRQKIKREIKLIDTKNKKLKKFGQAKISLTVQVSQSTLTHSNTLQLTVDM